MEVLAISCQPDRIKACAQFRQENVSGSTQTLSELSETEPQNKAPEAP